MATPATHDDSAPRPFNSATTAGPLAGFGYEITLLKRDLALTEEGCRWLLVQAEDSERAAAAAALARASGTVEELIP